jgi:PAS domain S-box-containing protein
VTSQPKEPTFQQLVEAVGDFAIYMLDPDGRVISWSPAAEKTHGWRREDIEGQSFARLFTLEDQDADLPERILIRARGEGRSESAGWRLRRNGDRFWATAWVHAIRGAEGEISGFAAVTRDTTGQRAAQLELAENERRFRYLVEGVVDYAIYMLDVAGVVTNWNRGAERTKGYRAYEVVGRHFSLFYTEEDRAAGAPDRALRLALRDGRWESEGWRVRKDGSRFWASVVIDPIYDDDGRHIGFAKITRDISERIAALEALSQSERQFRMLVAGVVDYALFMLDPNGVVANWNLGAQHIKGYTAEEAIGQHVSLFYTEADRAAGAPMKALQTAIEQGRYETEAWRMRKDGSLFWAKIVLDAVHDVNGHLMGFANVTRDITERRQAQFDLQQAHDRLAQTQKMEAIGQLTGGVAHDFNNLLMVVSGQAQLLRRKIGADERAIRAIDAIETSVKRGQDLTRQLLAFARRQRLNPVVLSLTERATSFRELLDASLGEAVELQLDLPDSVWFVEVDPGELELALLNLAVNARDAMPNGGTVVVSARNAVLSPGGGEPDLVGEFVALTVLDSGAGIPPDILPRVFEPFFTTKDMSRGTGLGLSQVYGFVEQSGGRSTVKSDLGAGAAFTLYLPRSQKQASVAARPVVASLPHGLRVLVVEDNPAVAETAAALLEQLGGRPQTVSSAEAALGALRSGEAPDLLFSDIVMAGPMDGLALARQVRREWPKLPILLTTGYSQNAENVGREFTILPKPYGLPAMSLALTSVLDAASASDPASAEL